MNEASKVVQGLLEQSLQSEDIAFVAKQEVINQIDSPFRAIFYEKNSMQSLLYQSSVNLLLFF